MIVNHTRSRNWKSLPFAKQNNEQTRNCVSYSSAQRIISLGGLGWAFEYLGHMLGHTVCMSEIGSIIGQWVKSTSSVTGAPSSVKGKRCHTCMLSGLPHAARQCRLALCCGCAQRTCATLQVCSAISQVSTSRDFLMDSKPCASINRASVHAQARMRQLPFHVSAPHSQPHCVKISMWHLHTGL